ncbi:MAG: hypothetical protein LAP13_03225 [Acidobacteriia bacterium]|nr:hypothetical protein [Terriglobia bacterium]
MRKQRHNRRVFYWLAITISILALFGECAAFPLPGGSGGRAAGQGNAQRFPVAHEHAVSWCLGFLYVTPTTIRYEVVSPARDSRHAFEIKRSEIISSGPWNRYGQLLNATEIKFGKITYHFWLMPGEADVQKGRAYTFNPPDARPAATLIAALQGGADSATAENASAETPGAVAAASVSELASNGLAPSGGKQILAAGNPPLTQQMADEAACYFAWLLETPLTNEQQVLLQRYLVGRWQKHDEEEIRGTGELAQAYEKIKQMPEAQQQLVRQEVLPANLAEFRKGSADPTGKEITRELAAIYDASHKAIAPGNPPLTRQMTDAYVEVTYFLLTEASGSTLPPLTAQIRDQWAQAIAQTYPKLPDAQRKQITQMPRLAAALRVWWPTVPENQKVQYRQTWKQSLGGAGGQVAAQSAPASTAQSGGAKTVQEMMRQSQMQHQSFMNMMDFSMKMHYSTFNSINAMGGNPYRVVNAYGNPY